MCGCLWVRVSVGYGCVCGTRVPRCRLPLARCGRGRQALVPRRGQGPRSASHRSRVLCGRAAKNPSPAARRALTAWTRGVTSTTLATNRRKKPNPAVCPVLLTVFWRAHIWAREAAAGGKDLGTAGRGEPAQGCPAPPCRSPPGCLHPAAWMGHAL